MSRFTEELRDPWGLLLGATAGGAAWAVDVHPLGAVFVGVTVWLAKAGVAGLQRRGAPYRRGVESGWMRRALAAERDFAQHSKGIGGPLGERVAVMRPQVEEALATMSRLADHVAVVDEALRKIDADLLREEAATLNRRLHGASGDVAPELERALAALDAQLKVHERLTGVRARLLARLESGALGVEGLAARVVELSAMSLTGELQHTKALDELAGELDGLRLGLRETEEITRRALET